MKKLLISIFLIPFLSNIGIGQTGKSNNSNDNSCIESITYSGQNANKSKLDFYLDKEWNTGVIYGKNSLVYTGYTYRYNVYTDQIELRAIIDPSVTEYISIGAKKFIYSEYYDEDSTIYEGYFEMLSNGECKLLCRRSVKYRQASKETAYGIEASVSIIETLFLKKQDSPAVEIEKNKDFLLENLSDKKEVINYINDHLIVIYTTKKIKEIIDYYNNI